MKIMMEEIKKKFPELKRVVLKTDNASCMSSHNNIPFVFHLNKDLKSQFDNFKVSRWINMEAYTGKDFIDTHFSFINGRLQAYVLAGNNITTQQEIFQALSWKKGLAGTSVFILDFSGLESLPYVQKTKSMRGKKPAATTQQDATQYKGCKTGVRSTHDVIFNEEEVRVYRYTDVTTAEVIKHADLDTKKVAPLNVGIKVHPTTEAPFKYESMVPPLFVKKKYQEAMDEAEEAAAVTPPDDAPADEPPADANANANEPAPEAEAATTDDTDDADDTVTPPPAKRTKFTSFISALKSRDVSFGKDADHSNSQGLTRMPMSGTDKVTAEQVAAALSSLQPGWANKDFRTEDRLMSVDTLKRLHYLEERGRGNKNLRTTQDGAFEDVRRLDKMPDFCERLYCTLARIKAIMDMDTQGRKDLIKKAEKEEGLTIAVPDEAVENAEEALEGAEAEEEALVDEDAGTAEQQPNAVATDLDATDIDENDTSLPTSSFGRIQRRNGRYAD